MVVEKKFFKDWTYFNLFSLHGHNCQPLGLKPKPKGCEFHNLGRGLIGYLIITMHLVFLEYVKDFLRFKIWNCIAKQA